MNNINDDLQKGHNPEQKIALFYAKVGNKMYYYSYNFLDSSIEELYNSYNLVNMRKAQQLLLEQFDC